MGVNTCGRLPAGGRENGVHPGFTRQCLAGRGAVSARDGEVVLVVLEGLGDVGVHCGARRGRIALGDGGKDHFVVVDGVALHVGEG